MITLFKPFNLFSLIIIVIISTSCLKSEEDNRTEEVERIEISKFIALLEEDDYDVDTTSSGMYYIMHKNGTGEYPQSSDTCFVEYVGYFINGSVFDASAMRYKDGNWKVIYKETIMIDGFAEAIGMMKTGGEATFIIPSKLAYGDTWVNIIPPYTTLIFDLNMNDINSKATE